METANTGTLKNYVFTAALCMWTGVLCGTTLWDPIIQPAKGALCLVFAIGNFAFAYLVFALIQRKNLTKALISFLVINVLGVALTGIIICVDGVLSCESYLPKL